MQPIPLPSPGTIGSRWPVKRLSPACLWPCFNDLSNFLPRPPPRPVLVRPVRRSAFHSPPLPSRLVQPLSTPGWCLAGARPTLDFGGAVRFLWALPPRLLRLLQPRRPPYPRLGPAISVYAPALTPLEICLPRLGGVSCGTSRGNRRGPRRPRAGHRTQGGSPGGPGAWGGGALR